MSKLKLTSFANRNGSPFKGKENQEKIIVHQETLEKTHFEKQKEKQNELVQKVTKKAAEYQAHKPSSGVFTEVVTHGAFTVKNGKNKGEKAEPVNNNATIIKGIGNNGKSLLGFPSSANDLALDAKSDLESDRNISKEVKDKVIQKLFALVSMVQHTYESKVRIMSEFDKFKETHLKNESRREKEHSEQLYKLNMNFQNEVVHTIQRLRSELDISRNVSNNLEENNTKNDSIEFSASEDTEISDSIEKNVEDQMKDMEIEKQTVNCEKKSELIN